MSAALPARVSLRLSPRLRDAVSAELARLNAGRAACGLSPLSVSSAVQTLLWLGLEQPTATRTEAANGGLRVRVEIVADPVPAGRSPLKGAAAPDKGGTTQLDPRRMLQCQYARIDAEAAARGLGPHDLAAAWCGIDTALPHPVAFAYALAGHVPKGPDLAAKLLQATAAWQTAATTEKPGEKTGEETSNSKG